MISQNIFVIYKSKDGEWISVISTLCQANFSEADYEIFALDWMIDVFAINEVHLISN